MQTNKLSRSELVEENTRLEQSYMRLRTDNERYLADAVQLRRSNAQLNQSLAALRQMQSELVIMKKNIALGCLVAGVSHELNTPVGNCLLAASTVLHQLDELRDRSLRGISRSEMTSFIEVLRTGAEILMRNLGAAAKLVTDFKQISADRSSFRACRFDLRDVIEAAISSKRTRKFNYRFQNRVPQSMTLNGHAGALNDVVSELIDNALRHGFRDRQEGTIIIAARTKPHVIELTVEDDGCGIRPEHLEQIFDPFFTTTLGQGSSGLGLYAAYNLVSVALQGRIRVSSVPAVGTRFTMVMPSDIGGTGPLAPV